MAQAVLNSIKKYPSTADDLETDNGSRTAKFFVVGVGAITNSFILCPMSHAA